jgi:hypothetical protein
MLYLQEIVLHIQTIHEYTKGMTLEQFIHDRKTIDTVDANLRNIGEAMNVLSKIPQVNPMQCNSTARRWQARIFKLSIFFTFLQFSALRIILRFKP